MLTTILVQIFSLILCIDFCAYVQPVLLYYATNNITLLYSPMYWANLLLCSPATAQTTIQTELKEEKQPVVQWMTLALPQETRGDHTDVLNEENEGYRISMIRIHHVHHTP